VSGNRWEEEVQHRIFDRLNMSTSSPTMGMLTPSQHGAFVVAEWWCLRMRFNLISSLA
jgi:hypothetical protein